MLAVFAAVIIAYPQIYLRSQDFYQGIERINASDDESPWMSRVREVQDGYLQMSNPYLKDAKSSPHLTQPLGAGIIAYLGKLFSLDINGTILLGRLLFPFLVFLIIYILILLVTKEKLPALTIPTFLFLGSTLFARKGIFQILSGVSPSSTYLPLTRPVNPALTWFFFFGFILFFWLFLERKQKRWGILSVLMLGLSFYDYFYTWSFLYAFCGVLTVIFLLQKKWSDVKRIALVLFGAAIIAIPSFLNLYRGYADPTYQEVSERIGFLATREPTLGILVPLLLVIFLIFFPKQNRERFYFFLAMAIAPFIALNQQLITGRNPMNAHYHWYFSLPLAIILLLMMLFFLLSQRALLKKIVAVLIILVSFGTGIFIQQSSYAVHKERIVERQQQGPVMDWFNEHAQKEEVVFANVEISKSIVIYTPLNVFYHPTIVYLFSIPRERLLESLFVFYRLDGVDKDEAQEVFFRDRAEISSSLYGIYYRETAGDEANIPDEIIQNIVDQYRASFDVSTADFLDEVWNRREVQYLVWDKKQDPQWNLDQYEFLKKVAELGDMVIYQK